MNSADCFAWTVAAVAELTKLANEGESASRIGAALGVSRNAVIGKCQRLNITLGSGRTLKGAGSRNLEARLHARREDSRKAAQQPKAAKAPRPSSPAAVGRPLRRPAAAGNSVTSLSHARPELARQRAADFLATPTRQRAFDPAHAPDGARIVKLEDLLPRECRWPLYEDGPMVFCGCRVTTFDRNGQPDVYCEVHLAMRNPRVVQ